MICGDCSLLTGSTQLRSYDTSGKTADDTCGLYVIQIHRFLQSEEVKIVAVKSLSRVRVERSRTAVLRESERFVVRERAPMPVSSLQ